MSDIQKEIYEHLRLLGIYHGSPTAPPGKSTSIFLNEAWHELQRLTEEVERLRMRPEEREALIGAVALYAANNMTNSAALLHALAARLGGGE